MYKITVRVVAVMLSLIFGSKCFSQIEKFDIITYTAPKDWKKDAKQGAVNYTNINAASGGFCVISLFASSASTGDPQNDFNKEWESLVATLYAAESNPKTETQTTADGWKAVVGAAPVKLDGNDIYIILTVFSGFGKKISIRTSLNDQSYTAQVDALLETMHLDKTASATTTAPTSNTAGPGKFGLMSYKAPTGWSHQVFQDGVVFKPLDLPTGEHLSMQVMQPVNFAGGIEQVLQQSYNEAAAMYNGAKMHYAGGAEYEKKEARRSFKGWEYIRGSGGLKIENGTPYPDEFGLELIVIKVNNRFERIAILKSRKKCPTSQERYYPSERPLYYNAIEDFLFSIQFSDLDGPVVKPGTINGNGIVGVWEGISMSAGAPSSSDPLGLRYKVFTPIFFSNGQAYFGSKFPSQGLDGLNTWIRAENFRRDWGTWTFSNGRGVLKLLYGDLPMRIENNKFIITANNTDHAFHQLNSVDGARFNGTYVMSEAYGKIPVISFTADGRFTDKGAIQALYHESDYCTNPGLMPGSGTYEVKNHSVIFHFSDGREIKVAFLGAGYDIRNQSPASMAMGFNEDEMRRQ